MNQLENFFYNRPHRVCQKWTHYFDVYDRFFRGFKVKPALRMLEIGVSQGGSLDMWRDYFGSAATIVGVDISENCKRFEAENTFIRIGSQDDPTFLRGLLEEFPSFDIVLDDGGHTMSQQVTSFLELYSAVAADGVYMVEDCHTNYQEQFGGGIRKPGTFIELAKVKIDELNGRHVQGYHREFQSDFMKTTRGISFFDSMVVFEKGLVEPQSVQAGT